MKSAIFNVIFAGIFFFTAAAQKPPEYPEDGQGGGYDGESNSRTEQSVSVAAAFLSSAQSSV